MNTFVLKNRDYLLLFLGSLVSNLGTHIYNFALSLYIYVVTDGNAAIAGLYLATGGIVYVVLSPFGGAIVDRMDKVRVVYLTDYIRGIAVLLAGFALFADVSQTMLLVILFATTIVLGINGALFNPAASALPPHILDEDQLQQASSMSQGMFALYGILGAALGGILYGSISIEYIFIINGVSFIASGFSEMFIRTKTLEEDDMHVITIRTVLIDIKEGFVYVVNLKPILWLLIIASMLNFFTVPMVANGLPYLFEVVLDVDPINFSIIMASFPIGIIITSVVLGSVKQKEKISPLIFRGLFGMAFSMLFSVAALQLLFLEVITFFWFMVITTSVFFIMGLFNGYINIPFSVAIMKVVDKNKLGRVTTIMGLISNGLSPIAITLGGLVLQAFGLLALFYGAAIAMIITAFWAFSNKYVRQL
jgi:MFS family permease